MLNMSDFLKKLSTYSAPTIYVIKKAKNEKGIDGRIVSATDRHSYLAEQYKVIRTNLYSLSPQAPFKTIVMTSSQPQEGKSVTSANLSYTLSLDAEKKVVLIDADFRRPTLHKLLGIPRKPGFTDILNGKASLGEFTKKPNVENLYVIPSGTLMPSPSEFLSSVKMKGLIEELKAKFDYVIFDTPPVINVTDSCILGSICDCVLLVARVGVTPKNMIEEAFTMLKHAQAKPKACILTDNTIPIYYYYMSRYKYYYRYKYGYRGDKPQK